MNEEPHQIEHTEIESYLTIQEDIQGQLNNQNNSDISLQSPKYYKNIEISKRLHQYGFSNSKIKSIIRKNSFSSSNSEAITQIYNQELAKTNQFQELILQSKNKNIDDFQALDIVLFSDNIIKSQIQSHSQQQNDQQSEQLSLILFEDQQQQKKNSLSINILIENGSQNGQFNEQEQSQQGEVCPICSGPYEQLISLLPCEHKFCRSCYIDYLEDKIKIAKIIIPCLQAECNEIFPEKLIQELVSQKKFTQYLEFKKRQEIENDPNKKWCPVQGCELYVTKDPKSKLVKCACGAIICFNCGNLQHPGLQCEQALEIEFQGAVQQLKIKYCPNCRSHIEKNSGCNHMTCSRCSHQFCWVCLQKYHQYHYRYWSVKGCAIWANGRFKTRKEITNPDRMRKIYLIPRILLFAIRPVIIFTKLTLKAARKSFFTPLKKINKTVFRRAKPKQCFLRCCYAIFMEILIILIVILLFPFIFLFYRVPKEIRWLKIKGWAY